MKISICLFFASVIFMVSVSGQTQFNEPWKDPLRALVLDPLRRIT
jgi:hypothetical protein